MKHKKRIRIVLLTLLLSLAFVTSGCDGVTYGKEGVAVFTLVYHAVPSAVGDPCLTQYDLLETDEYGRQLFAFTTSHVCGFGIFQKIDGNYVYYYDNVSWYIDEYHDKDTEELNSLKEANDWNEPYDEEKMIKRACLSSHLIRTRDSVFDWKKVNEFIDMTLGVTDKEAWAGFFDYSQTGQELFYAQKYQNTPKNGDSDYEVSEEYLMILNADGTYDPDNYLMKIDDWDQINELLAEIKENNGWEG